MPEWSDFHFNVTLLISQRCNVQDTKALSGLHISLIPYAFTHVIITIALHISISAFWGAIRVLPGHGLQPQSRLKFVGHLPVPPPHVFHAARGPKEVNPIHLAVSIFCSFGIPLMDPYMAKMLFTDPNDNDTLTAIIIKSLPIKCFVFNMLKEKKQLYPEFKQKRSQMNQPR